MTRPNVKVDTAFDATYSTAAASRTWTDVTGYVLAANSININHGRQDEHSQAGPNTCALTLDNRDGRFSPGLASSPYYPNVKIGRPERVAVNFCTTGDYGTFEADATGWFGTNATVARTTAQAHSGSASLSVTATTAASMAAVSENSGTAAFPVAASTVYRATGWVRTAVTGRTTDMRIDWYDSGGTLISTDNGADVTDSTTWQLVTLTATSPATAVYGRPRVLWTGPPAAGEVHYVDDVRFDVDRYTGYVDEWPVEWPAAVSTWAVSGITATSRMARLGLLNKLKSIVEQEILADSPVAYYTMGEAEGATRANDSSGNGQERLVSAGSGTAVTFGTATGPGTDGLTAAQFAAGGKYLRADYGSSLLPGACSIECALLVSAAPSAASRAVYLTAFNSAGGIYLQMETDGTLTAGFGSLTATTSGSYADGQTHHVMMVTDGLTDGATVDLYVDGVLEATATDAPGAPFNAPASPSLYLLGQPELATAAATIAHVAIFDSELSLTRVSAHATAVLNGFSAETAAARLARYAGYAGIPAAEYSFSSLATTPMAHIDTTGKGPVELMQTVETTDGGVLYDGTDGVLTYVARSSRYNATARLTLDVAAGEVQIGYSPKLDRSALINKMTATLSDGTYSVTAENTTSSDEYGAHGPGDLELATTSQDEAHAAAWWRVNTYGEPSARAPRLGVELASMSPARQAAVLAVKVGDKITVTNLPSQSDASTKSFFVEGWTERITDSQYFIEFNVSPTTGFDVWEIEHATYGQYDAYPICY